MTSRGCSGGADLRVSVRRDGCALLIYYYDTMHVIVESLLNNIVPMTPIGARPFRVAVGFVLFFFFFNFPHTQETDTVRRERVRKYVIYTITCSEYNNVPDH